MLTTKILRSKVLKVRKNLKVYYKLNRKPICYLCAAFNEHLNTRRRVDKSSTGEMKRSASLVVSLVNIGLAMSQENAANALAIVSRGYGERRVAHVDDVRVGFGLHELLHALGSVVDDRFVYGCHRATVQMVHVRVVLDQHTNYVSSVSLLFFVYCLFIYTIYTLFNLNYHVFNELMCLWVWYGLMIFTSFCFYFWEVYFLLN